MNQKSKSSIIIVIITFLFVIYPIIGAMALIVYVFYHIFMKAKESEDPNRREAYYNAEDFKTSKNIDVGSIVNVGMNTFNKVVKDLEIDGILNDGKKAIKKVKSDMSSSTNSAGFFKETDIASDFYTSSDYKNDTTTEGGDTKMYSKSEQLHMQSYDGDHDEYLHRQNELQDLLAAGIIEKSEFNDRMRALKIENPK